VTGDPYASLVVFAERERALVDEGRLEELAGLAADRDALIATLPARAPRSARPALERAHALQVATAAVLRASLGELRHSMAALDRAGSVARAYVTGPPATPLPRVNAAA
jgi:hypothetical protein